MTSPHTFHIPVMGTAFSIDTPIKVAKYGISSVISLVDDALIEDVRKIYCQQIGTPYAPITKYDDDFRARRITEYLNLVDHIVQTQFEELRSSAFQIGSEITKYFEMLPETSPLKALYQTMLQTSDAKEKNRLQETLRAQMQPGDINVNIMTKVDRDNYAPNGEELGAEFSDALSALRGYGQSTLKSAIVFSAGINRRLYSYVEEFKDFYADRSGEIRKQIILKVSDYRSALTQGKFFAKKGLWVSEYRIESGLNCGGHAFATDGFLMGPIMEEFRSKRAELIESLHSVYTKAVELKQKFTFANPLNIRVTAQGGIGNANEDTFLREHYKADGTGWGTPLLLVPEATNVDEPTLKKLAAAREEDLYLSDVSPLGVPFNNLRGSSADQARDERAEKGRPGSACPKGHLVSNREFTKTPICTASRQYQKLKIDDLNARSLPAEQYQAELKKTIVKSCICNDLGEAILINHQVVKNGKRFTAVCPGPNLAYFSHVVSLKEMVDHIYGRTNIIERQDRPHMFIKELKCYIDYLSREIERNGTEVSDKMRDYFNDFKNNLLDGIEYYRQLFPQYAQRFGESKEKLHLDLASCHTRLASLVTTHRHVFEKIEPRELVGC